MSHHTVKIFFGIIRKISGKSCFPGHCGDLEIINTLFKRLAFIVRVKPFLREFVLKTKLLKKTHTENLLC